MDSENRFQETRILVVEDERLVAKNIRRRLQQMGYEVPAIVENGQKAIDTTLQLRPNLVLMDIHLEGDMTGIEAAAEIRTQVGIPVIYLTAYANESLLERAKVTTPFGYILKPFLDETLRNTIEIALYNSAQEQKLRQYHEEIQSLNAELEERVRARTAELDSANKELRSFVYAASHDLKTPLHGIGQLTLLLVHDYAEAFDAEGRRMTELLIERVGRMDRQIDAIRQYAAINRRVGEGLPVDLGKLINGLLAEMALPEHIRVTVSHALPVIHGEKALLKMAFRHLLKNAVTFMDKVQGKITVDCTDNGPCWTIEASDNGPGIPKAYHEKIFQIFETLTPGHSGEQIGFGLALVKKIVEAHDGTVGVESEPGKGSTFLLNFPKQRGVC